ncbi:acyl-CoA synthetase [Oceanicella actignis]|uniref:acyl-CoA synthetase n=1 Tax=Oceanicella actignis TaxID=1189325 RepID=UPI0011E7D2F1|nr:acyl-CoA synthetase [Oceanicella actignis]TYO90916.1 fatty-acyl-CoA synthase [Oceanicella actignis]
MPDTAPAPFHIRRHAQATPDKTAFRICATGEEVSFAALEARANQGAHLLRRRAIGVGDHIAILMENRREFLETCFAADRAGVYYTTISTHLTPAEIAYILRDCGARLLIGSTALAPLIEALRPQMAGLPLLLAGEGGAEGESLAAALAAMPDTPIADERQGLDMLYSSGTTGRPKGIKWPLPDVPPGRRDMLIDLLTGLFGYGPETRYLNPAPLYHAAPLRHSMVAIKAGGSVFVMDRFDPEEALRLIEAHRITHSQWVPTMFVRMLKLPPETRARYDLSSMRMAVHAAAPCPIEVKRRMIEWWGPIIHEYYSGTENNGFTAIDSAEWLAHPGSVGRARLGVIHICDETGRELPVGAEGEVYFESGQPFSYHNDPEKTAASRNAQGWTTLGDIGRLDEEGYLYLTDRKSFVIISGGVNIYPQEIEDALVGHPAVMDVAVFGVPNEEFGEEVKAVVQPAPGHAPTPELAEELMDWCRARLSRIKRPRSIEFRERLPRTPTGKLYKRLLRDEYLRRG